VEGLVGRRPALPPSGVRPHPPPAGTDELHLAIAPILLGSGERLFDNLEGRPTGYECVELVSSPAAAHVRLVRTAANGSG
jgi:hypothetical protein